MNFVIDNNVLVQVHTQCLAAATSIRLKPLAGVPPWKMPPNVTALSPTGALTLMDRLDASAAKVEIVHYTARADNGDGTYTYTITRGQEGTTAKQWEVGEYAVQIPTAAGLFDAISWASNLTTVGNSMLVDGSVRISQGGVYNAGAIYSDPNWGMIFIAAKAAPTIAEFAWQRSSGSDELMRIANDGSLGIGTQAPAAKLAVEGSVVPQTDNAHTCGKSGYRWSAIWSTNGAIQTSDGRDKRDVARTPLGLAFIQALNPVAYRWEVGGYEVTVEDVTEEVEEPETRAVERTEAAIEIVDGVPVRRLVTTTEQVAVCDEVGVVDSEGNPVLDGAGAQFTHPVPRMRRVTRLAKRERRTPRAGVRLHHGLIAQEVQAALKRAGVDFGGLVQVDPSDPDSELALRYDQFVAPLIAAVQELAARVKALESRLPPGDREGALTR